MRPFFKGNDFRRNLEVVRELEHFASEKERGLRQPARNRLDPGQPRLQVAIVGARHPRRIEDSVAAAELSLSEADLEPIDRVMAGSLR